MFTITSKLMEIERLKAEALANRPKLLQPTPKIDPGNIDAEFNQLYMKKYEKLAEEIEFTSPAILRQKFFMTLSSMGRGVYDFHEVQTFLDQELGKNVLNDAWGWRGLRHKDIRESGLTYRPAHHGALRNGRFELRGPYAEPVPIETLSLVKKISETVLSPHFYVSDVVKDGDELSVGDPFLAVSFAGMQQLVVVACWDEPGFLGKMK
jgi:hypothetical protein